MSGRSDERSVAPSRSLRHIVPGDLLILRCYRAEIIHSGGSQVNSSDIRRSDVAAAVAPVARKRTEEVAWEWELGFERPSGDHVVDTAKEFEGRTQAMEDTNTRLYSGHRILHILRNVREMTIARDRTRGKGCWSQRGKLYVYVYLS